MALNNKTFAIAIAAFMVASFSPANAQDVREILTDRSSQQVMEYRKGLNDHDMLHEMEVKGQFKDHVVDFDGNVTDPVRLMSKYQAGQGFRIGAFARGSYFAGNFLPAVGMNASYGYRNLQGTLWASFGKGERDVDAFTKAPFLEQNYGLELGYSVLNFNNHHDQIDLIAGVELKLRMDDKKMSFGDESPIEVQYIFNGRTFGAYGGVMYRHSHRFSSWDWYVKATAGFGQNYKGNILGQVETPEYTSYSVGGTKVYGEFTLTLGFEFNVFNRKVYNHSQMSRLGKSKADVKAMQRLANY